MRIKNISANDNTFLELVVYRRAGGGVVINLNNQKGRCVAQEVISLADPMDRIRTNVFALRKPALGS